MLKFSVIVPLIPEHDPDLRQLFRYLKTQEDYIYELIVCRSETPLHRMESVERKYQKWLSELSIRFELIVLFIPEQAYDGTNRNRGLAVSKSDYIVFLDADDQYNSKMFTILSSAFLNAHCDAVLHNFTYDIKELNTEPKMVSDYQLLEYSQDSSSLDFSTPISLANSRNSPRIHHAHLSINKNKIRANFLDIFPGADTEYCKRIIHQGARVLYIDEKLSFWNRKRSFRYKIRLAKKKFGLNKTSNL